MIEQIGNLWDFHEQGKWICVTTNGTITKKGLAVMGRGCALEAKTRYPELAVKLGADRNTYDRNKVRVFEEYKIIILPVKHNWWEKSDLILIEAGLKDLVSIDAYFSDYIINNNLFPREIYLPRAGCGNGKLDWESQVKPLYVKYLSDRYVVLTKT